MNKKFKNKIGVRPIRRRLERLRHDRKNKKKKGDEVIKDGRDGKSIV
jgi:hypothetical protein